jgi:hypothetical protein
LYTWQTIKKEGQDSLDAGAEGLILKMPSAPKKTTPTKKKSTLSPEEHALLMAQRREAVEKRLLRLQAKIDKDRALLLKYALPPQPMGESEESETVVE